MYASTFGLDYWKAALDYWRDPDQKSWILVNPAALGDTWCTCALAGAFRKTYGGPLTLVIGEHQRAVADMYAHQFDRIITWEPERLGRFCIRLMGAGHFDMDEPIIAHPAWHGTGNQIFRMMIRLRYPEKGGLNFLDQWRMMLRLPWDAPIERPHVPDAWREEALHYAKALNMPLGESVIIFPDNNTNPPLPASVWEKLARAYSDLGLTVYTNLAGNRQGQRREPLIGTRPITINLQNAIPLVELAGRYATMANGMQGLLQGSGIKAKHTYLIHDAPKGRIWGNLGYEVDDMMMQSSHCTGVIAPPYFEYLVNEQTMTVQLAAEIARDNPDLIAKFFISPDEVVRQRPEANA